MSGFDYFKKALTDHYADFHGRARRSEYWYFVLFSMIVYFVAILLGGLLGDTIGGIVTLVVQLALLVPSVAVAIRRLHDTDRSGWYYLLVLIPILGAIVLIYFLVQEGTPGPNTYGDDPKGRGASMSSLEDNLV